MVAEILVFETGVDSWPIENPFLSFLHAPVHVITVGDVRFDWLKRNPLKMIKVQRER